METTAATKTIGGVSRPFRANKLSPLPVRPGMFWQFPIVSSLVLLLLIGGGAEFGGGPHSAQALPVGLDTAAGADGGRVYFAALLRDASGRNSLVPLSDAAPMFRLLATPVEQQKKRRDLRQPLPLLAKKYDRNCFFSPVQCTLQQWSDGGNPAEEVLLGGNAGRRRRR